MISHGALSLVSGIIIDFRLIFRWLRLMCIRIGFVWLEKRLIYSLLVFTESKFKCTSLLLSGFFFLAVDIGKVSLFIRNVSIVDLSFFTSFLNHKGLTFVFLKRFLGLSYSTILFGKVILVWFRLIHWQRVYFWGLSLKYSGLICKGIVVGKTWGCFRKVLWTITLKPFIIRQTVVSRIFADNHIIWSV